ncbi:MAG TPA: hypothetical protein VLS25_01150 [Dehalococcoidia bacterium]|nr:hypothetical protein [Dehalococcoidia bacterium]
MEPRDYALRAESAKLPRGDEERFSGWGIMGLPFRSGHILGLRRFAASSVGPGYTSVWHRDPAGSWTFYANVEPLQSCNRFFGAEVDGFIRAPIAIDWEGPRGLRVSVPEAGLQWTSKISSTPVTRILNAIGSIMPDALWKSRFVLSAMAPIAGTLLHAGRVRMNGRAPNGQSFIANPLRMWTIDEAEASIKGEPFGPVGPVAPQAQLGDFAIPQRGVFVIGRAFFESYDPAVHLAAATSREAPAKGNT